MSTMPRRDPFRSHRFPTNVILLAVRWYWRYPLSYRDVRDMLVERGIGRRYGGSMNEVQAMQLTKLATATQQTPLK